jgi:two-component sensor histidine kinase
MEDGASKDNIIADLRQELQRRDRDLQELNHRIANSLQIAAGFLAFERKRVANLDAQQALAGAASRLEAVGKLHRYLYQHSQDSEVEVRTFLEALCPDIAQSTGLGCSIKADAVAVPAEMAQKLAIVINELALNARKHGYGEEEDGILHVECRVKDGLLRLSVADGGRGLGDGFDVNGASGLGLTVIRGIAKQLGGRFEAEDAKGARFTLTAPMPAFPSLRT